MPGGGGVARLVERLEAACETAGRDPRAVARTLSLDSEARFSLASVDAFDDAVGRARELGFTDVVSHWPRRTGIYAGEERVLDEVAGRLDALR